MHDDGGGAESAMASPTPGKQSAFVVKHLEAHDRSDYSSLENCVDAELTHAEFI